MNAERRERVEAVCAEALEREGDERARFVEEACRGDAELRTLVDWLLAEHSGAGGFLETPPWWQRRGATPAVEPLAPGTRLGPYQIHSFIRAGGMGEVYKGRDSRLGRTVAIKILPAALAADPERRRRFEQEARAVSALSHPNICTLYDVGSSGGQAGRESISFLVMEYLAGETLAERLAKGALPVAEALSVGAQVASALAAAHRQGIIHRDLKPGNVMLTKGVAKLLDFGVAKLVGHGEGPAPAYPASAVPTKSATLTGQGMIVGTVQYMAPEQVEGRPADARTDLWALGAILYEMLTGKPAFEGSSVASVMVAIVEREPRQIASLQPLVPPALDRLVRKCLAKDPDARWQTAADVADELRWLAGGSGPTVASGEDRARPRSRRAAWQAGALLLAALVGVVLGGWLWRWLAASPTSSRSVERSYVSLADTGITNPERVAVSPDGETIVFAAIDGRQSPLYVRRRRDWSSRALDGTEGVLDFCFSPDGLSVNFLTANGLHRVPVGGGAPVVVESDAAGKGEERGRSGRPRLRSRWFRRPLTHHGIAAVAHPQGWREAGGARSTG